MNRYSLTHVPDGALVRQLRDLVSRERSTCADVLAHLAEVDERRLYVPAGYPSMFAYCVGELRLSENESWKRIQVARVARRIPEVFERLADGRLHLAGASLLAPCLTRENATELLARATHQSKRTIEQLVAERFPRPDLPERVITPTMAQPSPGKVQIEPVAQEDPAPIHEGSHLNGDGQALGNLVQPSPGKVDDCHTPQAGAQAADFSQTCEIPQPPPGKIERPVGSQVPRIAPLAPARYGIQFTVGQGTYEKLRQVQALLGHAVPSGDLAEIFDRALAALLVQLEKRKFAQTEHPRSTEGHATSGRCIPAAVRRAVWARDAARCTFVSASGHRCEARERLEFDHIRAVARGGESTEANLRLRCRAHNQHAADETFGAGFMSRIRESARGG